MLHSLITQLINAEQAKEKEYLGYFQIKSQFPASKQFMKGNKAIKYQNLFQQKSFIKYTKTLLEEEHCPQSENTGKMSFSKQF